MTGPLKQDTQRAVARFLAEVRLIAERAVIATLRTVLAEALRQLRKARPEASEPASPAIRRDHRRKPATVSPPVDLTVSPSIVRPDCRYTPAADLAAIRESLVACLRDKPGQSTRQLSKALSLHPVKVQRCLRALADDGEIRIRETTGVGGVCRRAHYVIERQPSPLAASVAATEVAA